MQQKWGGEEVLAGINVCKLGTVAVLYILLNTGTAQ